MATTLQQLRARRDAVNEQIEVLKAEARQLSAKIREAEGPILDRSGRARTGIVATIKPTKA